MASILPSGEELHVTPDEIIRYLNPDGLRQVLRTMRLFLNLKTNRDIDYKDIIRSHKFAGELHNEGLYQRMEIRTFPDNGAYEGYAGVNVDSGLYGFTHNVEKWSKAISRESMMNHVNRVSIGATAKIPEKSGYGLNDDLEEVSNTNNRSASIVLDPWDGRAYLLSNDDPNYVNQETRNVEERIPARAIARVGDLPTRITQLINDMEFISDPDYRHTDNNFTNSNRYVLDNLDDRTFVYPEIAKDKSGNYIDNYRIGLSGEPMYGESDGDKSQNTQPDIAGDRQENSPSSYNSNLNFSGVNHRSGYLPGIFRSLEELEKVDLVGQLKPIKTHKNTPGAKRPENYYNFDGIWTSEWYTEKIYFNESYKYASLNPNNMELDLSDKKMEPIPYSALTQANAEPFNINKLYQWRYNRITLKYYSKDITMHITESGENYKPGDRLRWSFGDDVFIYEVETVGPNGQIYSGSYKIQLDKMFDQDPATHGIGISFSNMTGVGHGAKIAITSKVTIENNATQIKNNLYAYVDITPTVRSDNTTPWSDVNLPDSQNGKVCIRSTAAGPAYSGINSGRGGPAPSDNSSMNAFYEHGGNATAGVHVHLFRYVIDTQNPTWVIKDGVQVFLGKWVDQGPMGLERPCDIKSLLFSNPDCNNFNNYYKFMIDAFFDNLYSSGDIVATNNSNALSTVYRHIDQVDPTPDRKFYIQRFDPMNGRIIEEDVTDKVEYINAATGVIFYYNSSPKVDIEYGHGIRGIGWCPYSGAVSK